MPDGARPLREAARALAISESSLRRWIARGAPQAKRGGRGRGRSALFDIEAVRAWRRSQTGASGSDALRCFAGEVSQLTANAVAECFVAIEGAHKRACASVLAGAWYVVTSRLLDRLRRDCADIGDVSAIPESVERLRQIDQR